MPVTAAVINHHQGRTAASRPQVDHGLVAAIQPTQLALDVVKNERFVPFTVFVREPHLFMRT